MGMRLEFEDGEVEDDGGAQVATGRRELRDAEASYRVFTTAYDREVAA